VIAVCHIRQQPCYRRSAFEQGLRAAGYRLVTSGVPSVEEDLCIIWNRYGQWHQIATNWEQRGGTVLVCENGYIGTDPDGLQYYAISAGGHNGSGWSPPVDGKRFERLAIDVKPWVDRPDGYALVCGQRGIGSPTMASPANWHVNAAAHVRKWHPNVRIRTHPGNHAPKTPLSADLAGAAYCVIWSSSSGVKALVEGIPVIYDAPHWICEGAASRMRKPFVPPTDAERANSLERMAHAQWSVAEIESGEPFVRFQYAIGRRAAA
jgi:hypothetical protein